MPAESNRTPWSEALGKFLEKLKPILIPQLIKLLTKNVGGIQGWLFGLAIRYGGRAIIDVINDILKNVTKKIEDHDREVAQQKAEIEKNKIVNDPNSTAEEKGKAYEDYFNTGRK